MLCLFKHAAIQTSCNQLAYKATGNAADKGNRIAMVSNSINGNSQTGKVQKGQTFSLAIR